jgi:hypothetical protein
MEDNVKLDRIVTSGRYYVKAIYNEQSKQVIGYGVIDGEKTSQIASFCQTDWRVSLHLANTMRDDLNNLAE